MAKISREASAPMLTSRQICDRCGIDPHRHEGWVERALASFETDRLDQVPSVARTLEALLPADAEGFEKAIVLGVALGIAIQRRAQ